MDLYVQSRIKTRKVFRVSKSHHSGRFLNSSFGSGLINKNKKIQIWKKGLSNTVNTHYNVTINTSNKQYSFSSCMPVAYLQNQLCNGHKKEVSSKNLRSRYFKDISYNHNPIKLE